MTVHRELEKAIAMAEAAEGSYMLFAADSEDEKAKQVFSDMAQDMKRHVMILESRKDYLEQHNQLNAGGEEDDQEKGKKGKAKNGGQDGSS